MIYEEVRMCRNAMTIHHANAINQAVNIANIVHLIRILAS